MNFKELAFQTIERTKEFWQKITITQRMVIGGAAVATILLFVGMLFVINKVEYDVLYSNIGVEDSNRVIKALEAQQIKYVLEDDGKTILIPKNQVVHTRVDLAGQNIITGQGIGFEVFDNVKVGETDFVQKLNYRRALEGELARTVAQFPGIESARIHLVIPHRSLFIEEQRDPSASVVLKIEGNKKVETKDIMGIVNLVSMSIEGLQKERISVTDATTGKILYEPDQEGSITGMTQTQLDHKLLVQRNIEKRIDDLLTPIMGTGHFIAKVNADLDFSQKTIRREVFDPERTVVRSEQRSEESTNGSGNVGGVPDPNFRGDGFSGSTSTQNSNRETRTTNYEINKEEFNIVSTVGELDRLTVAVIVDGTYEKTEEGSFSFTPKSDEELNRLRQLVANAVGFDSARGDTIEVSSISFGMPEITEEPSVNSVLADYISRFGKPLLNAVLVFLFLILIVRPVVLALIKPKVEGKMLEGLEGLPMPEERIAIEELSDEELVSPVVTDSFEDIKAHALQLSEQNMDQAINILRVWINDKTEAATASLPATT